MNRLERNWKNVLKVAKYKVDINRVSGCWKKHPDAWKKHLDAWKMYSDAMKRHPDAFIF